MKDTEEIRIAIGAPCRCSIGRCMYPRKPVSSQTPADMAETTTVNHFRNCEGRKEISYPWRNAVIGNGTNRNSNTIEA